MNENLFFASFVVGALISVSLLAQVFKANKSNFFLGLVTMVLSFEMLFSWGAQNGYHNNPDNFPISLLLNYTLIPPSLWLFVRFYTSDNFKLQRWHLFLYLPFILELSLQLLSYLDVIQLRGHFAWVFLSEYLPLLWLTFVIFDFWRGYLKANQKVKFQLGDKVFLTQLRFLGLMCVLTLFNVLWIVFSIIGWQHFEVIEYSLIFLFFGLALLNFLGQQNFQSKQSKPNEFPQFNDTQSLNKLTLFMETETPYLKPNLPLKELAAQIDLPARYVSYLINQHHQKNYKEYINSFRIDHFLAKAQSEELNYKTLLALAFESGFNSKSTFNMVFKNHTGKTPSDYLK